MAKDVDFSNARRGAVISTAGKTRITIYIDDDVLHAFRERATDEGRGYQTAMNEALRRAAFPVGDGRDDLLIRLQNAIAAVLAGVHPARSAAVRPVTKRVTPARKIAGKRSIGRHKASPSSPKSPRR